jgi:Tol biopolymer transport system component
MVQRSTGSRGAGGAVAGRSIRRLIAPAAALAACFAVAVVAAPIAAAGSGPTLDVPYVAAGEPIGASISLWSGDSQTAATLSAPGGGSIPATIHLANDGTYFYEAVTFTDGASTHDVRTWWEQNDGAGFGAPNVVDSTEAGLDGPSLSTSDDFVDDPTGTLASDTAGGGHIDLAVGGASDAVSSTVEERHPLCGADSLLTTPTDVCIPLGGAPLGFHIEVSEGGVVPFAFPAGSGSTQTTLWANVNVDSPPLPSPPENLTPPAINGTARSGFVLQATTGTWDTPGAAFTYQWEENGDPIAGATASSYRVRLADIGAPLSVAVTATAAGGSTTAVSDQTPAVPELPANGQIVWSQLNSGVQEIYQLTPGGDGTQLTTTSSVPGNNTEPSVSPDGSQIAFVNDNSGANQIWVMGSDGSSPHELFDLAGSSWPAWSPDGSTIAFTLFPQLELYSVATGTITPISGDGADVLSEPAWSPDGKTIVVADSFDVTRGLTLVDVASHLVSSFAVTATATGTPSHPHYAPDGGTIYYDFAGPTGTQLATYDVATGTTATLLAEPGVVEREPVASVDGAKLIWIRGGLLTRDDLPFSGVETLFVTPGAADPAVGVAPPAPETPTASIDYAPTDPSALVNGEFSFSADQPSATFECWVDDDGAAPCDGHVYGYVGLSLGTHTFNVRATTAAGTGDPASYTWTIAAPAAASTAGATSRVSVTSESAGQLSGTSSAPSISSDGSIVAFQSVAPEIGFSTATSTPRQIFVHSRLSGATTDISPGVGNVAPNGSTSQPSIAPDGSAVAFSSTATNLVDPADPNADNSDVFVWTSAAGLTRVTTSASASSDPVVSNGPTPRVAFDTAGNDIPAATSANAGSPPVDDVNGVTDVYLWSSFNNTYSRVSGVDNTQADGNGASSSPSASSTGQWVAYQSDATNLVPGDSNGFTDIFLRNTLKLDTVPVSQAFDGAQSNGRSTSPSISANGRVVAFLSTATNLVPGGTPGGHTHAFVRDMTNGVVVQADVASNGTSFSGTDVNAVSISGDGTKVVFSSKPSLPSASGVNQIWVHDLTTGSTTLVSVARTSGAADGDSFGVAADGDGVVDAFDSAASNLIVGDTNGASDVFARDLSAASASVTNVTASLTEDSGTVEPPTQVRINDIPVGDVAGGTATTPSGAPVAQIPVAQIPVAQIPVAQIDVANAPVAQIPIAQIGLGDPNLASALATVPITQLPLRSPRSWAAVLAGTPLAASPPQSVSLEDVLSLSPLPAALTGANGTAQLRLSDFDFSHSTLGTVPIVAWALGGVTLSQLPLPGATSATAAWCAALNLTTCPANLGSQTVFGESVAGAPVAQIPVAQIPIAQIPVAQIPIAQIPVAQIGVSTFAASPIAQIPVAQINITGSPIAQIPVAQIAVAGSPVAQIPIAQIAVTGSPVAQIPIAQIPVAQIGTILNCTLIACASPTLTLGDALRLGAIRPDATLGSLAALGVLNGITLGDVISALGASKLGDIPLAAFGTITIGQLIAVLPSTVTLGDVMQLLVGQAAVAWEQLPFAKLGVQRFAADGGVTTMHAQFELDGTGSGATAIVSVTLPVGAVYAPGSSSLRTAGVTGSTGLPDPSIATAPVPAPDGTPQQTLKWPVTNITLGDSETIDFKAFPPLSLGITSSSLSAVASSTPAQASDTRPLTVADPETDHPNDTPASAPVLDPSSVYFGYITTPTDTDYYRIPAPSPGTRVIVRIGQTGADNDLVVYSPSSSTLHATGITGQPLDGTPITDSGVSVNNQNTTVAPQVSGDVPLAAGLAVAGVSDNSGTSGDSVTTTSTSTSGFYTIQVSGYNGATSNLPYTVHIEEIAPPPTPACPPRAYPAAGSLAGGAGVAGTVPTIPANANTLFLFDKKRFGDTYGATAAQNVQSSLNELGTRTAMGVSGVVVPVEAYAGVQAAYDAWDANPCDPTRANNVANAIATVADSIRATHPTVKFIVNVGGDDIVPFFRIPDNTTLTNENGYATVFGANQYFGAAYNSDALSDDPYATTAPISFLDRQMFVPDLVVSRLVETPGQITQAVSQYENASGRLTPTSAYVSGYDFLADGSNAVADALTHDVTGGVTRRIDPFGVTAATAWTKTQILQDLGLLPPATPASILAPNGHYDHSRALTSKGGAEELASPGSAPDPNELWTTQDVLHALATAPALLRNRIIFTMGCHAGLPLSDAVLSGTQPPAPITPTDPQDWAQTYAAAGAIYIANTGFGIGDTASVAYSEQLMTLLAQHLNGSVRIGEALSAAKEDYFANLSAVSVYDEKAMNEAELYGLPMWTIGAAQTAVPAEAPFVATSAPRSLTAAPTLGGLGLDPQTGLNAASFSADPTFTKFSNARGDYYSNSPVLNDFSGYGATNYRPVEPKTSVPLPASNDFRGALILHATSADETGWHPAIVRPSVDSSLSEPALSFLSDSWPSRIGSVSTERTISGRRQQLELLTGAFFTDTTLPSDGQNVQRRWTHLDGSVFYNDSSADFTPPTFQQTIATTVDLTHVAFSARVFDTNASGARVDAKVVYVLFRDSSSNVWRGVFLQQAAPGAPWTGGAPVASSSQIEFFVQACDAAGNCSSTSDKARYFSALPPASGSQGGSQGTVSLAVSSGTAGQNGYYLGAVTLAAADSAASVSLTSSTDVGAPVPVPASGLIAVAGSGVHTVTVQASDGGSAAKTVLIDADNPSVALASPADGAVYQLGALATAAFTCADIGAGIQSCAGTRANGAALDTSTPGSHTFTVTATDIAGRAASVTHTYNVSWPFSGFFSPVDNLPTLNVVKPGQAVPVKFGLGGDRGLAIFVAGYPTMETISCSSSAPLDPVEQTVTAGGSSLSYDPSAQQYTYVWKTPSSGWASGACRQLVLQLTDGTTHRANFKAK